MAAEKGVAGRRATPLDESEMIQHYANVDLAELCLSATKIRGQTMSFSKDRLRTVLDQLGDEDIVRVLGNLPSA